MNPKSKPTIIAIEGLDCSFKETNSKLLKENLTKAGYDVYLFSFPDYESDGSIFIRKFLNGEYKPDIDNSYIIALFYSMDRFNTWKDDIQDIYENGNEKTVIIFDRWTFSNMIYQATREANKNLEIDGILQFIHNIEHEKFDLPVENLTLFLRMPFEITKQILSRKKNKDVNELNYTYLESVYNMADYLTKGNKNYSNRNFITVSCYDELNKRIRTKEEIEDNIAAIAEVFLKLTHPKLI